MSLPTDRGPHSLSPPSSNMARQPNPIVRPKSSPLLNNDGPDPRRLLRWAPSAVNGRHGAVLSRGFILKSDTYTTDRDVDLEFQLQGAPNFRSVDLNVYAAAQPTRIGLRTVLSALGSKRSAYNPQCIESAWVCTREEPVVYIGSRPFVLRDSARPTKTLSLSDRGKSLEAIEHRLKEDVLTEARKYGGVILVHDELPHGEIISTWIAADNVCTVREIFEELTREENYCVQYHRIPISPDQNPEDNYLDLFLSVMKKLPISTPIVFNCGVGVVRSTYASIAGLLIRRRQHIVAEQIDYFAIPTLQNRFAQTLAKEQSRDKSLLNLMQVMQDSMSVKNHSVIIELMTVYPKLLEHLRNALIGNYDTVLSLLPSLQHGSDIKMVVDSVVDHCSSIVNLREVILSHRLMYTSVTRNEEEGKYHLRKTFKALERYILTIAFAAFLEESDLDKSSNTFLLWLKGRSEIISMISRLRSSKDLRILAPVHDISILSRETIPGISAATRFPEVTNQGGEVVGDEWAQTVVSNRVGITLRSGTILKRDIWYSESEKESQVRGALNFRKARDSNVFALAQPTEDGIDGILRTFLHQTRDQNGSVFWINLREEPLIYIAGYPYVLRSEVVTLRNTQLYSGISSSRLELIEDRLKGDILSELQTFDGRILLHSEQENGTIVPIWETVSSQDVKTLREIMEFRENDIALFSFKRIPVTAEAVSPDFSDLAELMEIVTSSDMQSGSIIVNCQLGRGRSTLTQILIVLIQHWVRAGCVKGSFSQIKSSKDELLSSSTSSATTSNSTGTKILSYQVVNNLLRLIRHGREIKFAADKAIIQCNEYLDLVDVIEDCRIRAEEFSSLSKSTSSNNQSSNNSILEKRNSYITKGLTFLKKYFFILQFTAYLNQIEAETPQSLKNVQSFENFIHRRPEFSTIEKEIDQGGLASLSPLSQYDSGPVSTDEIREVVAGRTGSVLSARTILKSDFFSMLQKMSLPERIDGAPNFRRVRLFVEESSMSENLKSATEEAALVFGCGMPTVDGMRRALKHMDAGPNGSKTIYWTSMREEPVLYVNGRPHVLRLLDEPLTNVVTTGVKPGTVESMEEGLKRDILREHEAQNGRVLLHDEIENHGHFDITAQWEDVKYENILTPSEVFKKMKQEGYQVNYERLPVTDEQAPIPGVFSRLEERVGHALQQDDISLAFNCQMGRGRTTTAMIAAALVANILVIPRKEPHTGQQSLESSIYVEQDPLDLSLWDGDREDQQYVDGEYKLILRLVGVLQYGPLAKKLTDKIIDAMDGVQNLRKAILENKRRADAAEYGSKKRNSLIHVTQNYLYRYGALIAFASYLFERTYSEETSKSPSRDDSFLSSASASSSVHNIIPPFPKWMEQHREVSHVLSLGTLD